MEIISLLIIIGIIILIIFIILYWIGRLSPSQSREFPVTGTRSISSNSNIKSICQSDSDCFSGSINSRSLACVRGHCELRSCRTHSDCSNTEACLHHRCIPTEERTIPCQITSDCPADIPYCVSGQCRSHPAKPPINVLVETETCTTDSDCSTGICEDTGLGVKACNTQRNGCFVNYSGTSGTGICPADRPYCRNGECSDRPGDHLCLTGSQCPEGQKCVNGRCQFQPGIYGDRCSTSSDCGPELKCSDGKCVPFNYIPRSFDGSSPPKRRDLPTMTEPNRPMAWMGTGYSTPSTPSTPKSDPTINYPSPLVSQPIGTMGTGYPMTPVVKSNPPIGYPSVGETPPIGSIGTGYPITPVVKPDIPVGYPSVPNSSNSNIATMGTGYPVTPVVKPETNEPISYPSVADFSHRPSSKIISMGDQPLTNLIL